MVTPKEVDQIAKHIGKVVYVNLAGEQKRYTVGNLSFFNWEQQVIHLSEYKTFSEDDKIIDEGKFIIINQKEWKTLRVLK